MELIVIDERGAPIGLMRARPNLRTTTGFTMNVFQDAIQEMRMVNGQVKIDNYIQYPQTSLILEAEARRNSWSHAKEAKLKRRKALKAEREKRQ